MDYWLNQYYLKYPRMVFPQRDLGHNSFVPELNVPLDLESYAATKGFVSPSHETNLKPKDSSGPSVQQQAVTTHQRKKTILVARPPNRSISVKIGNAAFVNTSTTPSNKKEEAILTENEPVLNGFGRVYLQQLEPSPAKESGSVINESGSIKKESPELQEYANPGSRLDKGPSEGDPRRTNEATPWNDFFMYGNPNMCYMILPTPNPGLFPGLYPRSHMPFPYSMSPGMFPNSGGEIAGCYPGYLG